MEQKQCEKTTMQEKQRIFYELNYALLREEKPSRVLREIGEMPGFQDHPFSMLRRLKETGQSPEHHPEGSVWNHTLLVTDEAARRKNNSKDPVAFMWAALLHDIGKPDTTQERGGRYTAYGHDELGARLARDFLTVFSADEPMIQQVCGLIRWHMQILFVVKGMRFADIVGMKRETDVEEVALLGLCDRLGRYDADREKEERNIARFLQKCGIR